MLEFFDFISHWIDGVENWISVRLQPFWARTAMVLFLFAILGIITLLLEFLIRRILNPVIYAIVQRTKLKWDEEFYRQKVFRSLIHLIPLSIAFNLIEPIFHSYEEAGFIAERILQILLIFVFIQLIFRIVKSFTEISKDDNNYTTIGIRTFGQLIKIVSIFMGVIILIALLFNVKFNEIITVLGALTAVLILVFQNTILGFVSGVQISTTKMVKVGDWILVDKYNVEGYVREINLTTVKIEKFDKTMAMVPTYDLISSQIINFMPMLSNGERRIKRSIFFNIQSFEFYNDNELGEFNKMELLKDYILKKQEEFKQKPKKNGVKQALTNIGLFRKYTELYLKIHPNISDDSNLLVRQMEITPQGLPLEIYCFTNTSDWATFEQIQSDIFDHLLTKAKFFNLEAVQTISS